MNQKTKKQTAKNGANMFKHADDLKDFVTWAKDQKIQRLKIGDIEVEFSALAHLTKEQFDDISNGGMSTLAETETQSQEDETELLFLSST